MRRRRGKRWLWVVLLAHGMGLTQLNLLLYPIIPAGGGLPVTMNAKAVLMSMTMVMMNMPAGHGSGWS